MFHGGTHHLKPSVAGSMNHIVPDLEGGDRWMTSWPPRTPDLQPSDRTQPTNRQALPIQTTASITDTTAPPHFTVFLILECGFTA